MPTCPQNIFHPVPTPQTPFSTAPMPSKHISHSANTSNPLFNPPPCPQNIFHTVPTPETLFSTKAADLRDRGCADFCELCSFGFIFTNLRRHFCSDCFSYPNSNIAFARFGFFQIAAFWFLPAPKFVYRLGLVMIGESSYNVDCDQVREVVVQDVQTQILGRLLERETERLEVDKVGDLRLALVPRTIGIDCAIQVDTVEPDELWYKCMEQRAMYMLESENVDDFNVDDWWYAVQCAEDVDNLWRLDPMWSAKVFQVELNSPCLCPKCFACPRYLAHMSSAQAVEYGLGLLCVECAGQCTDDVAIDIKVRFYDEIGYDETPSPVTGSPLYQSSAHRREKHRSRNKRTQFRRFENTSRS